MPARRSSSLVGTMVPPKPSKGRSPARLRYEAEREPVRRAERAAYALERGMPLLTTVYSPDGELLGYSTPEGRIFRDQHQAARRADDERRWKSLRKEAS